MKFILKGLSFFTGKLKTASESRRQDAENPYVKAADDLKRSVEDLKHATRRLQESFRHRQEVMNKLFTVINQMGLSPRQPGPRPGQRVVSHPVSKREPARGAQAQPAQQNGKRDVGEAELFEIYREACLSFVEPDKTYYFKLRNHSDFLCALYKRQMGNLRYYDHEFFKLASKDQFRFNELEAYVANQVIQSVNRIGRETFIKEGHQRLYSELCALLLPRSANQ